MKTKTHIITIQNSGENFLEQQFWLYLNGVLVASLVHIVSSSYLTPGLVPTYLQSTNTKVLVSVVLGLLFSSLGGLVVAAILKKLDNVVKEYSYAIANLFTALQVTVFILLAMGLLLTGIYFYEKKSFNSFPSEESNSNCDKK